MTDLSIRANRVAALKAAAKQKILILDGSWGVMFQKKGLTEADYRAERFADYNGQMKGNNDILCLTRPDLVAELHDAYFAAGADISETNTFSGTTIAQADYHLAEQDVWDINFEGAKIGRSVADRWNAQNPASPKFIAGSIGPLNVMLSMSSDVNDPGARKVTFDQVYAAYRQQVDALYKGGVDLFLIETITDTLNCKAAIKAILDLRDEGHEELPIWISGTITDRSGRTLSGQTAEAFWNSVKHAKPFAVGFNCALGADLMRPHIAEMARIADTLNCKAAIKAILDLRDEGHEELPIWISGTITDRSGRTLSGQTAEAFWNSVKHAKPFAVGFNCALGADLMRPHIAEMARIADTLVAAYPNAGLPNAMGQYDEEPHQTGHALHEWAKDGLVNILGGCCGTTPDHIRHVADEVRGVTPRAIPERPKAMRLAGLEPFELA